MEKEIKIIDENGEIRIFSSLEELNKHFSSPSKKKERTQRNKSVGNGNGSFFYSKSKEKWIFAYHEPDGNRKFAEQRKNEPYRDFQKRVTEIRSSLDNGTYVKKQDDTIEDIAKKYIEQKWKDGLLRPASYKRCQETLSEMLLLSKKFSSTPIRLITSNDIEKSKELMREYSKSVIDKIWSLLCNTFKIAYSRRIISFNIMDDITLKKPQSLKKTKKCNALTLKEQEKFENILNLDKYKYNMYSLICLLQLEIGARIGEILALKMSDIDLENNTIHIHSTIAWDGKKYFIQDYTKTYDNVTDIDYGERTIPMSKKTRTIILAIMKLRTDNIMNLLFWDNKKKSFMNYYQINSWLRRINIKHKILDNPQDRLHTHKLRHTAITRMFEANYPLVVIQAFVGHVEGSKITEQVYISVDLELMRKYIKGTQQDQNLPINRSINKTYMSNTNQ